MRNHPKWQSCKLSRRTVGHDDVAWHLTSRTLRGNCTVYIINSPENLTNLWRHQSLTYDHIESLGRCSMFMYIATQLTKPSKCYQYQFHISYSFDPTCGRQQVQSRQLATSGSLPVYLCTSVVKLNEAIQKLLRNSVDIIPRVNILLSLNYNQVYWNVSIFK